MYKKLMLACMAIAAFAAFVVAPAASASPELTENGVTVAAGSSVTAVNTGVTKFTGFGVECSHAHLAGTVTSNTGTKVKGEIPVGSATFGGTGTNTDCTSPLGSIKVTVNSKLCLETTTTADQLLVTGCGGVVTFTLEITGTGPCRYETSSVSGTFTTNTSPVPATITEKEAKGEASNGFFCPGSGKLDMTFDLYTTDGTPLTIS